MEIDIKLNIPDELLNEDGETMSRTVFEQVVAESYKSGKLTIKQVRILLGFSSRFEVDEFLHSHHAYGYGEKDLEDDLKTLRDLGLKMIVIADTGPINYLILIDEIEILPRLYGTVIIPNAVFEELNAKAAPDKIKNWLADVPGWLEVKTVTSEIDAELSEMLDAGESEAIELAQELGADLVIIDEALGREIAVRRGLRIIGTIGVLALASRNKLIDAEEIIQKLEKTNFYLSPRLKEILIESKNN